MRSSSQEAPPRRKVCRRGPHRELLLSVLTLNLIYPPPRAKPVYSQIGQYSRSRQIFICFKACSLSWVRHTRRPRKLNSEKIFISVQVRRRRSLNMGAAYVYRARSMSDPGEVTRGGRGLPCDTTLRLFFATLYVYIKRDGAISFRRRRRWPGLFSHGTLTLTD